MKRNIIAVLFAMLLALLPAASLAASKYPPPEGYLTDTTGTVSRSTRERIDRIGAALESATSAQAVVAVVSSTGEEALEDYAIGLFREWGVGSKEKNNGVLLLIALDDRRTRIEVGYGLEGAIPDGKAGRILDEALLPYMRQGDTNSGIEAAYDRIVAEVAAEYQLDADSLYAGDSVRQPLEEETGGSLGLFEMIAIGIGVLLVLADLIFNRGRVVRALLWMLFASGRRGGGGRGSGGGGFRGGGGSSGGGGASRGW